MAYQTGGSPKRNPGGENQERRTWLTFGLQSCGESISIDRDCVSLMLSNLLCPSRRRVDSRAEGPLLDGLVTHGAAHRNARDAEASAVYPVVQPDQLAELGAREQKLLSGTSSDIHASRKPASRSSSGTPSACSQLYLPRSQAWNPHAQVHAGAPSDIHTSRRPAS